MLVLVALVVIAVCTFGKKAKTSGYLVIFSRLLGLGLLFLWCACNVYYFLPAHFKWSSSLPLQVCDIVSVLAVITMIKPKRLYRTILYFYAITLVTQAIITPTGNQDPVSIRFWLYWGLHAGIISCAIYDIVVMDYRPALTDFLKSVAAGIGYVTIILPIDIIFNMNYGYIGNSMPDVPTIVNMLGPWPQRIFWIILLATGFQLILLLPWPIAALFKKNRNKRNGK